MTDGSMARSLFNQLPEFLRSHEGKFPAALQALIAPLGSFFEGPHLFSAGPILPMGVIRGLDLDLAQGDDVRAADNADILTPGRGRQPSTQILLGVSNR